jgi:hypothetical protein
MEPTNTVDGVAMNDQTPLSFTTRKFSNYDEFVIPNDLYSKVRFGRDKHSRWDSFTPSPELSDGIKTSLYKDGRCYVTCELTGASVCLRHEKRSMTNESLDAVPEFFLVESEADFSENEDYIDAYYYALETLALSEDQSDFFAQCVLSFLDEHEMMAMASTDEYIKEVDSAITLQAAIDEVREVSAENELDPHYELDIFQRLHEYIKLTYEV